MDGADKTPQFSPFVKNYATQRLLCRIQKTIYSLIANYQSRNFQTWEPLLGQVRVVSWAFGGLRERSGALVRGGGQSA